MSWRRWEDNIKMDFKEMVLEGVESIYVQCGDKWGGLFVYTVMNL
jgi:hypothetical protein